MTRQDIDTVVRKHPSIPEATMALAFGGRGLYGSK
jgi:hypothetical protein